MRGAGPRHPDPGLRRPRESGHRRRTGAGGRAVPRDRERRVGGGRLRVSRSRPAWRRWRSLPCSNARLRRRCGPAACRPITAQNAAPAPSLSSVPPARAADGLARRSPIRCPRPHPTPRLRCRRRGLTNYVFAHSKYSSGLGQRGVLADLLIEDDDRAPAGQRSATHEAGSARRSMTAARAHRADWLVPCAVGRRIAGSRCRSARAAPKIRANGWKK